MAIKPPEILNRLPSVSELLDKPPIRALAERWNRSVVAGGVRSFLDELTHDLRRRTADIQLPSVRELAERAARYVVSQQQQQLGTAINATGRIWGCPWKSRPLPDAALEHAAAIGQEFVLESSGSKVLETDIDSSLCQLTGAEAALAVHSYAGALWLALATLAADREVLVARAEVGDFGPGEPLPNLIASAQALLREVGTTNRALAADYDRAISTNTAIILSISPDEYRVIGQTSSAGLEELAALTREREMTLIGALGTAPLADPPPDIDWPQRSVRAGLAAGVDLALVRGDGLVGGPPCGLLLGRRDLIVRVSQHPLCSSSRLDVFRSAALASALKCHQDAQRGVDALPTWQLLTTPIENLRNRAERMAPQLAQAADVATAAAVETRSPVAAAPTPDGGLISCAVALTARTGSVNDLDNRLRSLPLPIVGRIENDRLILDLRTVIPRQDRVLIEAIVGASKSQSAQPQDEHHRQPDPGPTQATPN